MAHPLVLALFGDRAAAADASRRLHALGVERVRLSIVARTHDDEQSLSRALDATPGAEIEDSRLGGLIGELGGQLVAAIAVILPGGGHLVGAGPLAADLGEAVGHVAGGLTRTLEKAGLSDAHARRWQARVREGAVLLGVHSTPAEAADVRAAIDRSGAEDVVVATWPDFPRPQAAGEGVAAAGPGPDAAH